MSAARSTLGGDLAVADDAVYRAVFLRMHPTGKAVLILSEASQGQEAMLARVAAELIEDKAADNVRYAMLGGTTKPSVLVVTGVVAGVVVGVVTVVVVVPLITHVPFVVLASAVPRPAGNMSVTTPFASRRKPIRSGPSTSR